MKSANMLIIFGYAIYLSFALTMLSSCSDPKELKTNQIRQKFKEITGQDLPKKADSLRAVYYDVRDLQIFVRFETDSNGTADVFKKFSRPDAMYTDFDEYHLKQFIKSGAKMFPAVAHWQEKCGIQIYDEESFGYGRYIEFAGESPVYEVYIDDKNSTIYIYARIQ